MFESRDAARQALKDHFDAPLLDKIVEALVPAVIFVPIPGGKATLGGTRLGGTPDFPAGLQWPRPPMPDDAEAIARRGGDAAAAAMREHFARKLPYAFFAQVDLTEAAALGAVTSVLPPEGRLLFFYDLVVGPLDSGMRAARVIWDRSPREDLASSPMPADLAEAAARNRKELDEIKVKFGRAKANPETEGTNCGAPGRAMTLKTTWRLPHPHSLDIAALPEIHDIYRSDPFTVHGAREALRDAYDEALDEHQDSYPDNDTGKRQQLLGNPLPEQDDPRYEAVAVSEFGEQHLSSDELTQHRARIEARARDWLLLLQIDIRDWMQADLVEGTVYFLIRKADLAARTFDTVFAVYQQS